MVEYGACEDVESSSTANSTEVRIYCVIILLKIICNAVPSPQQIWLTNQSNIQSAYAIYWFLNMTLFFILVMEIHGRLCTLHIQIHTHRLFKAP